MAPDEDICLHDGVEDASDCPKAVNVQPCEHGVVEKDDDGRDRWFYVCLDCDQVVELTAPDEDGKSYWEVVDA